MLLSPWPGLLLDARLITVLWDHFMLHYFSPGVIVGGWKTAVLDHLTVQPLAAVMVVAALDGDLVAVKAACDDLPTAALVEATRQLGGAGGAVVLYDAVVEVIMGWQQWSMAVKCMVAAATAAGLTNGEFVSCLVFLAFFFNSATLLFLFS